MQNAVFERKKIAVAARAIWKGVLKIGANKVPVKLYSAVKDRTVHFHILDKSGKQPVKQRMVDPENDEEVPEETIRRGLEVKPGTFVLIDDDEVAKFEPKASRDIEITRFVTPARINHQWYERPYYLGPDGDTAGYFALAKALESSEREGVARWVMRNKQYVGALNAKDGYLFLVTLRHADEVISAKQLPKPRAARWRPENCMAEHSSQLLKTSFDQENIRTSIASASCNSLKQRRKAELPSCR